MEPSRLQLPLGAASRCIQEQENIPGLANCEGIASADVALLPIEPMTPPPKRRCLRAKVRFQDTCVPSDDCLMNSFSSGQPAIPRCRTNEQADAEHSCAPSDHDILDGCQVVGRDEEFSRMEHFLEGCLGPAGRGGHLYVSGSPGTGKTVIVRKAVAAWIKQQPTCKRLEVNCMDLTQRSLTGLLVRLWELCGLHDKPPMRLGSAAFAAAFAQQLARLGTSVVVIVDEVDQIVKRPANRGDAGDGGAALETLFSFPHMSGAPAVALIAIANAVDLLERTAVSVRSFSIKKQDPLLFKPYTADQLREIVRVRIRAAGCSVSPEVILGRVCFELGLRQVAKKSGDCRQVLPLVEQALMEVNKASESATTSLTTNGDSSQHHQHQASQADASPRIAASLSTPLTPMKTGCAPQKRRLVWSDSHSNPLKSIKNLPVEQQVLLCALTSADAETVRLVDLCSKYKDLCRRIRQPLNLASKAEVASAVSALEQRGLLEMRGLVGRGKGSRSPSADSIIELAVSRAALKERLAMENPVLVQSLD